MDSYFYMRFIYINLMPFSSSIGLGFIIFICLIFVALKVYLESDQYNLKCIISNLDGETYCVRDHAMSHKTANLLARVAQKSNQLIQNCLKKHPDNPNLQRLAERFDETRFAETLPTSTHPAFSENKGEKIAFCIYTEKGGRKVIDHNTLMFVALHELAHIMTLAEGHGQTFWANFKFLLTEAVEEKIYIPVDYKKTPVEYCSMTIQDNPLFDM